MSGRNARVSGGREMVVDDYLLLGGAEAVVGDVFFGEGEGLVELLLEAGGVFFEDMLEGGVDVDEGDLAGFAGE